MASRLGRNFKKIKVGLAPTRRDVFSKEDSQRFKKLIQKKLKDWKVSFVNINWLNDEGLLFTAAEVPAVAERFEKEGVDALFVPHCNFGTEDAVATLGQRMGKPLLLWGPRDEAPLTDGTRLRDTQCGLFATSKILRRAGVPFTYIVNSTLDSKVFERGFKNFIAASSVVRAFRSLRIGQIGTRPGAFWTVMVNEGELLEKFGIEVVPITLSEIANEVRKKVSSGGKKLSATVRDMKQRIDLGSVAEEPVQNLAALKLTIEEWANRESLSAVAIQCWTAMQDELGIVPCFVDSELTGLGIPIACETDIHGAVSSVMAQAAGMGEAPTFFADVTIRHPKKDNSELLWHCGPFPSLLADKGVKPSVGCHYILESGEPGVCDWRIKGGDISVTRFDGDHGEYSLFMGHAKGTTGPYNRGTYVWIEVKNWPLWEEKLIYGPYIHHVAGIHGHIAPALYEACRYIDGLSADPVEPTGEEIRAYLRGE